jgi:hypothetical protein
MRKDGQSVRQEILQNQVVFIFGFAAHFRSLPVYLKTGEAILLAYAAQ